MTKSLHEAAAEAARRSDGPAGQLTLQVRAVAARLHCTEGQVYSMAIGLTVASLLAITGGVPLGNPPAAAAAPGIVATPEQPGTTFPETPAPPDLIPPEDPLSSAPPDLPPVDTTPPVIGPGPDLPSPDVPTDAPTSEPTQEPTEDPTEEPEDVTISKAAWYSTTGPVESVPEETLPVAASLGQPRDLSVVTLEGTADELVLQESAEGQTSPETAAIKLCPLDDGETYEQATGQLMTAAPAYDCTTGADGVRSSSGRWTFAVSGTGDYALVPQSASPLDLYTVYLAPVTLGF